MRGVNKIYAMAFQMKKIDSHERALKARGVARVERLPTARTEVVAERICEGALAGGKPATGPRIRNESPTEFLPR